MSTLRKAAQQALEALESSKPEQPGTGWVRKHNGAKRALRKALAQQAEPAPGWCKHCKQYSIEEPLPAQQAEPTQTPCDIAEDGVCEVIDCCRNPQQAEPKTNWCGETCERAKLCAVCARELAGGQAESVDQTVMELAESVGLIGPASRAHDLHGAIQRFHDLIVMNASIKAAQQFAETLAQQAEPVAWIDLLKVAEEIVKAKPLWKRFIDGTPLANDIPAWMADFASEHYTSPPAPKQAEPVDNEAALRLAIAQRDWAFKQLRAVAVASAEPVAPPQRKPLTDEEISRIYVRSATHAAFARAIERAHGIGGDDGQA